MTPLDALLLRMYVRDVAELKLRQGPTPWLWSMRRYFVVIEDGHPHVLDTETMDMFMACHTVGEAADEAHQRNGC